MDLSLRRDPRPRRQRGPGSGSECAGLGDASARAPAAAAGGSARAASRPGLAAAGRLLSRGPRPRPPPMPLRRPVHVQRGAAEASSEVSAGRRDGAAPATSVRRSRRADGRCRGGAGGRRAGTPRAPGLGGAANVAPRPAGARAARDSKMKLWDVAAVCVLLLSAVSASPLPAGKTPPEGPRSVLEGPEDDHSLPPPYAVQSHCKNRSPS